MIANAIRDDERVSEIEMGGSSSKGGKGCEESSHRIPVGFGVKRSPTQPVVRTSLGEVVHLSVTSGNESSRPVWISCRAAGYLVHHIHKISVRIMHRQTLTNADECAADVKSRRARRQQYHALHQLLAKENDITSSYSRGNVGAFLAAATRNGAHR